MANQSFWPMSEVWAVVFTGIAITFIGLIVLILFCSALSLLMKRGNSTAKPVAIPAAPAPAAVKAAPAAPALSVSQSDDDEVVAAIMAAVSAMGANDQVEYIVTGIRRLPSASTNNRPAWGQAGIRDNTSGF